MCSGWTAVAPGGVRLNRQEAEQYKTYLEGRLVGRRVERVSLYVVPVSVDQHGEICATRFFVCLKDIQFGQALSLPAVVPDWDLPVVGEEEFTL